MSKEKISKITGLVGGGLLAGGILAFNIWQLSELIVTRGLNILLLISFLVSAAQFYVIPGIIFAWLSVYPPKHSSDGAVQILGGLWFGILATLFLRNTLHMTGISFAYTLDWNLNTALQLIFGLVNGLAGLLLLVSGIFKLSLFSGPGPKRRPVSI